MILRLLMILLCAIGIACSSRKPDCKQEKEKSNITEVIYFHSKKRCSTCNAIERLTKEVIAESFTVEIEDGSLHYRVVDISQEPAVAEQYEVAWSSLLVVDYDSVGRLKIKNLTKFAFSKAQSSPQEFRQEVAKQITTMLNN